MTDTEDDVRAIRALIARQFAALSWREGEAGDWDGFAADFLPGAPLYPSARPAAPQTVEAFLARMRGLAGQALRSLDETVLGAEIRVFGNIAVATVACGMTENGKPGSDTVEILLLVKDGAAGWRIAAQAWDMASAANPVPAGLIERRR